MGRYDAGETLASIARTYDCSPPAISYVVSRSRKRQPASQPPVTPSITEPQLIKAAPSDGPLGNGGPAGSSVALADAMVLAPAPAAAPAALAEIPAWSDSGSVVPGPRREANPPRAGNGHAANGAGERNASFPGLPPRAAPQRAAPSSGPPAGVGLANGNANGDQRRTLHLSLGQAPHGNGNGSAAADPQPAERVVAAANPGAIPGAIPGANPGANPGPQRPPAASERYESAVGSSFAEPRPPAHHGPDRAAESGGAPRRDGGGAFIDKELRARVEGDITVFLAAFDAALVEDTQESRSTLREATDRLLRAGARTRIELERLEARIPLPPRDNGARGDAAWRYR